MLSLRLPRIAIPIWRCEPVCFFGISLLFLYRSAVATWRGRFGEYPCSLSPFSFVFVRVSGGNFYTWPIKFPFFFLFVVVLA